MGVPSDGEACRPGDASMRPEQMGSGNVSRIGRVSHPLNIASMRPEQMGSGNGRPDSTIRPRSPGFNEAGANGLRKWFCFLGRFLLGLSVHSVAFPRSLFGRCSLPNNNRDAASHVILPTLSWLDIGHFVSSFLQTVARTISAFYFVYLWRHPQIVSTQGTP
jgi:hypothetical protein